MLSGKRRNKHQYGPLPHVMRTGTRYQTLHVTRVKTQGKTLYDNYGIAGQFWAAHGLQCSDMTSLVGNNVAGMVFDAAKSVDRPLVRDARRRPDEKGGDRDRAERAALLLLAHHGDSRHGAALGAEDPDDFLGHGGRVYLP